MNNTYRYFAFISYNSKDTEWGKRLQRKLEHYRMPSTLCSEHNWQSKTPIRPVFFAPTDIQPGGLSDELKQRLEASQHLIVICSPNSARSEWVGREIAFFHSLGRTGNIHFFIVDGTPNSGDSATECFNPIVRELGIPEILGANIHEKVYRWPWLNKERAYIQLITKLLGVDFDLLWQRHRRLLVQQTMMWMAGAIAVVIAIVCAFLISKPVDIRMSLNEITPGNDNLPPMKDARVSLILANEKKDTTFTTIGESITFTNVPADMIGREVTVRFSCPDYCTLDTTFILSRDVCLGISRDVNAYGNVHFTLYNQDVRPVSGTSVFIEDIEAVSDDDGRIEVSVPIQEQRTVYRISSHVVELEDTLKDAKCGDCDAIFTK